MPDHQYFVYILSSNSNSTIYTGVTNDLETRVLQHKLKTVKGFSSKYNVDKLVHFEEFNQVNDAIAREKQLKNWKRIWKNELIEKENPKWKDLSEDWYHDDDLVKK
ncbi:GIY-YIG nuclease family protein [Fulvivirga lutea]|uniref:GIY-YIG nuclease family protein n=1 Tax=Fulvivirga lutea TaxID=2810512 RepID=A0A974WIE4_9BACT|nr:GIY-YIG nuclease family protein [Fulvivirga lutea]QSE97727.1 GIY-YIG nuclease family protein [Fulvivirga lutea]